MKDLHSAKLKIRIDLFGILMAISLYITHSYLSLAAILAASLHELGHIIAARLCGISLRELRLGIFGASLKINDTLYSYKQEIALSTAGPAVNFISALLLFPLIRDADAFISFFIAASLFLGTLNLLPVSDFDGGRILSCAISSISSPDKAQKVLTVSSFVVIFSLWCLSVYFILRLSASLSLFIFSLALFAKIFISAKQ